jgi:hypothetical protein
VGPSYLGLLRTSGPRFARDAFGAPVIFYVGWKLHGLVLGVALASTWSLLAFAWERKHGRPGVAPRIGLGIACVQAVVGLLSQSAVGYFAPPIVANFVYGLAFLVSVAIGRPLAAVFAVESYPIPAEVRDGETFRRAFMWISLVWGLYMLARSVVRLVILLNFSVDIYIAMNVITGAPLTVGLIAWSFWYGLGVIRSQTLGGLGGHAGAHPTPDKDSP